jgi:hypothetical protein
MGRFRGHSITFSLNRWLLGVSLLFGATGLAHASTPFVPYGSYTVPFAAQKGFPFIPVTPPPDGATANASFAQRSEAFTQFEACGQENAFLGLVINPLNQFKVFQAKDDGIDDVVRFAMAKLEWLQTHDFSDCDGTFLVPSKTGADSDFYSNPWFGNASLFPGELTALFNTKDHGECGPKDSSFQIVTPVTPQNYVIVQSHISSRCLQREINVALQHIKQGNAQPGTDGFPCDLASTVVGDWDMRMKGLMRVLFLDRTRQTPQGTQSVLSELTPDGSMTTRQYILQNLISIDGGPGQEAYSWTSCGDNEKSTGSAQDRDDDNGEGSDLLDSIGDILTWFLRRLILIAAVLSVAGVIAAIGGLVQLTIVVAGAAAVAAILAGNIPETENHRLMIESTRFLNNQLIIAELGEAGAVNMTAAQADEKAWWLKHLQMLAKNDFVEYNSRPYHGFAIDALRNLAQFATDPDVRNGAQMVIEYSDAKFAVGSNENRRLVPFRRHFAAVDCIDGNPCALISGNTTPANMFDQYYQVPDSDVAEGLLLNGQNQQQPAGNASYYAVQYVYSAATGQYAGYQFLPNPLIQDIAIVKDGVHLQRIHHAGYEVFSSGPSATIAAGGIETTHANNFQLGPVVIGSLGTDSQGAGVPTTVIFTGNPSESPSWSPKMSLDAFISFRGTRKVESGETTFTDNLCVWNNIACGVNVYIPKDIVLCLQAIPNTHWLFLNSSTCDPYSAGPQFFLAFYLICDQANCQSELLSNMDASYPPADRVNAGFLEIADSAPGSDPDKAYTSFKNSVLAANPANSSGFLAGLGASCLPGSLGIFGTCSGHYHTFSGHDLQLNLLGHRSDSNSSGVEFVDGTKQPNIGDWPLAQDDFISSKGDGVITILNPRLKTQVILDFSDMNHPCRRTALTDPCVQQ